MEMTTVGVRMTLTVIQILVFPFLTDKSCMLAILGNRNTGDGGKRYKSLRSVVFQLCPRPVLRCWVLCFYRNSDVEPQL